MAAVCAHRQSSGWFQWVKEKVGKKKRERKLGLEEGNKLSLSLRGHCGRVEGAACWVNVS